MKCYVAGSSNPQEYNFVEVCFAGSTKEAKSFMWKRSHRLSDECDGDYMDVRVNRSKENDKFLDKSESTPYLVSDSATLRQMGWRNEDDAICAHCGMAEMGDEFPVCEQCESCGECGHDDECSNTAKLSQ